MKKSAFFYFCLGMSIVILGMNIAAFSVGFCDMYRIKFYGYISDVLGKLTANIPFALGEVLMYVLILIIILLIVLTIIFAFLRNRTGYRKIFFDYSKFTVVVCLIVALVYTFTWSIPFRGSVVKIKGATDRKYKLEEVINIRNNFVNRINALANEVERDKDGKVVYDKKKIKSEIVYEMKNMGNEYPLLKGYYPPMKEAMISDILEMMNIGGYTYPYTMEVTYNKYSTNLYYPFLFAHESSHHQGYYKESEANYLAFLGCVNSNNKVAQYSGYIEIYNYFEGEVYARLIRDKNEDMIADLPKLSEQVINDINDSIMESKRLYDKDNHPAEKFSKQIHDVSDTGWDVQSEVLKEDNYDGVVNMVLQYYDVNKELLNSN